LGARCSISSFTVCQDFNNINSSIREWHYCLGLLSFNDFTVAVTFLPIKNLWVMTGLITLSSTEDCKRWLTAYCPHSKFNTSSLPRRLQANVMHGLNTAMEIYIRGI
jgi:hypothetical protein